MKHQLLQCQHHYEPAWSVLALVIAFFILPYFTDVAYYADNTPTHYAQEDSKLEGKTEADIEKIPPAVAAVQNDFVIRDGLTPQDICKWIICPTNGDPSVQRLFLALVISRPPPVA